MPHHHRDCHSSNAQQTHLKDQSGAPSQTASTPFSASPSSVSTAAILRPLRSTLVAPGFSTAISPRIVQTETLADDDGKRHRAKAGMQQQHTQFLPPDMAFPLKFDAFDCKGIMLSATLRQRYPDAWISFFCTKSVSDRGLRMGAARRRPCNWIWNSAFLTARACQTDNIADTIDYGVVVEQLREPWREQHFLLLEALAEHIAHIIMNEFHSPWVKLSVAKLGMLRGVKRVGVTIERGKR